MRTTHSMIALAIAGAAIAGAAPVQAAVQDDARCLLSMVALSHQPKFAGFTQAAVPYYAGRVRAQDPTYDFNRLKQLATTLKPQDLQGEVQRCGPPAQDALRNLFMALSPPKAAGAPGAKSPAPKTSPKS